MPFPPQEAQQAEIDSLTTDGKLVLLARAGNARAFEMLCLRYYEPIKLYLIRLLGNDATGYELTQETFLKAWQSLPGLQETEHFVGWLYRIATNIARDYQRRARLIHWLPWEMYSAQSRQGETGGIGPERQIEEAELLQIALAQVPLKYRACLVLYIVEDLPQARIAERLGIKASYVSNYVSRGLAELRRAYVRLTSEQESSREEQGS
jgi:RNA polymerase sigma-70 factor (ECF subfamily)